MAPSLRSNPDFTPASTEPLSSYHGGLRIPFDRKAGAGRLGWYLISEEDFNEKNSDFVAAPSRWDLAIRHRRGAGGCPRRRLLLGPRCQFDPDRLLLQQPGGTGLLGFRQV